MSTQHPQLQSRQEEPGTKRGNSPPRSFADMQVYHCTFELYIQEATMTIKFPCAYLIQLKSINGKLLISATKNKVQAIDSVAKFNENLKFETQLLYNKNADEFQKKDVLLLLNLISNRRPDQMKLVGRIPIDLGQLANTEHYSTLRGYKLEYCSVDAHVSFKGRFIGKKLSATAPERFDRDSFSDYQSFIAGIHNSRDYGQLGKAGAKNYQDNERTVEIGKNRPPPGSIPHHQDDTQKIQNNRQMVIEEDRYEDLESRVSPNRTSHKVPIDGLNQIQQVQRPSPHDIKGRNQEKDLLARESSGPRFTTTTAIGQKYQEKQIEEINQQFTNPPPIMSSQAKSPQNYKQPSNNNNKEDILERLKKQTSNQSMHRRSLAFEPGNNPYLNASHNQSHHQYEQILRNSHAQEKRIWEEEKRLLNQQISREKLENVKLKERTEIAEKKLYQNQLKFAHIDGKIQNSKRQMAIFQRQKNLQVNQLKSKTQRALKDRNQAISLLQNKQLELREINSTLKIYQGKIRATQKEFQEKQAKLTEALANSANNISEMERIIATLRSQSHKERNNSEGDLHSISKKNREMEDKVNQLQEKLKQAEIQISLKKVELKQKQNAVQSVKDQAAQNLKLQTALVNEKLKNFQQKIEFRDKQIQKLEKQIERYRGEIEKYRGESEKYREQMRIDREKQRSYISGQRQKQKIQQVSTQQQRPSPHQFYRNSREQVINEAPQQALSREPSNSSLNPSKSQLFRKIQQKESIIRELENKFQEEHNLFTTSHQDFTKRILTLTNQILEKDHELNELKLKYQEKELSASNGQNILTNLEEKINNLSTNLQEKQKQLRTKDEDVMKMKETIDEMKQYQKGLEEQLLKIDENNREQQIMEMVKEEKNKLAQYERKVEQEKQELLQKIQSKIYSVEQLQTQKTQLTQYIKQLQEEVSNYQKKVYKLEEQCLQKQIKIKPERDNAQQQLLQQKQKQIERLKALMEENKIYTNNLEEQILKYHEENMSRQKNVKMVESVNSLVMGESSQIIAKLKEQLSYVKQYKDSLEEQVIQYHEKIDFLEKELKIAEEGFKASESQVQGLHLELKEVSDQLARFAENGDPMQMTSSSNSVQYQQQIQQYLNHIEAQDKNIRQLQKRLSYSPSSNNKNQRPSPSQNQNNLMDEDYLILQDRINQKDEYICQLEEDVFNKQKQIHQLQKHNVVMKKKLKKLIHEQGILTLASKENEKQQEQGTEKKLDTQEDLQKISEEHISYGNKQTHPKIKIVRVNSDSVDQIMDALSSSEKKPVFQQQEEQPIQKFQAVIKVHSVHDSDSNIQMQPNFQEEEMEQFENFDLNQWVFPGGKNQKEEKMTENNPILNNEVNINSTKQELDRIQKTLIQKQAEIERLTKIEEQYLQIKNSSQAKRESLKNIEEDPYKTIESLKIEKQQLEEINHHLEEQCHQLLSDKQSLLQNFGSNKNNANISEQSSQFIQTIEDLTRNIRDLEDMCSRYEDRITFLKNKQAKMQETVAIIEEQSQKIITELEDKELRLDRAQVQASRKDKIIEELNQKLRDINKNAMTSQSLQKDLDFMINQVRIEYDDKVSSLENQIAEYQEALRQKNQQNYSQQKQIRMLNSQLEQTFMKIDLIQQGNANQVSQKMKEAEQKIEKLQKQLNQANQQLLVNKKLLSRIRSKEGSIISSQGSQKEGPEKNIKELTTNKRQIFTIQNIQELQSKIQELEISLFSHQANQNQKQIKIFDLNAEVQQFKNLVKSKQNQIRTLVQEIRQMQKKLQTSYNSPQQEKQSKEPKKSHIIQEEVKKSEQNIDFEQQNQKIKKQLQDLQNQSETLQQKLSETQQKLSKIQIQLQMTILNVQQKDKNIKFMEEEIGRMEELLKDERRGYYEKKRILEEEKQQIRDQLLNTKTRMESLRFQNQSLKFEIELIKQDLANRSKAVSSQIIHESFLKAQEDDIKQLDTVPIKVHEDLQGQYKFCAEELKNVNQDLAKLEQNYLQKVEEVNRLITQLQEVRFELQLANQQNQLKEAQTNVKNNKSQNSSDKKKPNVEDFEELLQHKKTIEDLKDNLLKTQQQLSQRTRNYEETIKALNSENQRLTAEIEEKQIESMNNELDYQLRLKEREKSNISNEGQLKKSHNLNTSQEAPISELIPACRILQDILQKRISGEFSEAKLENLMSHIVELESQIGNSRVLPSEKVIILEKSRLLSMELSKFKATIMKSKISYEERSKYLADLKPMEKIIKEILNMAEILGSSMTDQISKNL